LAEEELAERLEVDLAVQVELGGDLALDGREGELLVTAQRA
jgi:hypothetical protein